jgi:hypothetical protein
VVPRPPQLLQGRVAGRNSEDAAQIKAGLLDLQAQWKSFESSAQQVAGFRSALLCIVCWRSHPSPSTCGVEVSVLSAGCKEAERQCLSNRGGSTACA